MGSIGNKANVCTCTRREAFVGRKCANAARPSRNHNGWGFLGDEQNANADAGVSVAGDRWGKGFVVFQCLAECLTEHPSHQHSISMRCTQGRRLGIEPVRPEQDPEQTTCAHHGVTPFLLVQPDVLSWVGPSEASPTEGHPSPPSPARPEVPFPAPTTQSNPDQESPSIAVPPACTHRSSTHLHQAGFIGRVPACGHHWQGSRASVPYRSFHRVLGVMELMEHGK
ncbi:hypothetical protein BN1723_004660 [Verticillium longisporum]|uniref:Uncharacterized protein n=1 Tax=Verticillium longisporum TaxID=100787 RepID=A0A0G4N093_VERLO|nr:hypothetical protein BN1723_004660 [Verticillium longisporum]